MADDIEVAPSIRRQRFSAWWLVGFGLVLAAGASFLVMRSDGSGRRTLTPSATISTPSTEIVTSTVADTAVETTVLAPTSSDSVPGSSTATQSGAGGTTNDVEQTCGPTPDFRLPDFTGLTDLEVSSAFPASWTKWVSCYNKLTNSLMGAAWTYHDTCTTDLELAGQLYNQSPPPGTRFGPGTPAFDAGQKAIQVTSYRYTYCPPPPTEPATTTATT